MPVFNPTPSLPTQVENTVEIAKPKYKGIVVDTSYVPVASLLTNVEGSSWIIDYFSQVLDQDNNVSGQQVDLNPIYQQYRWIKQFELKVVNPLATQTNTDTNEQTVTGGANVYPSTLIPNVGDMFLADIGEGRMGNFRVTSVEPRSIYKQKAFFIEYVLVTDSSALTLGDLVAKTVETLVFERDFLIHGQNPLIIEEDWANVHLLQSRYKEILDSYFKLFHSNEYKTMLLPGQQYPTYDHFLMKALMARFNTWDTYLIRQNRILNCDDDDNMSVITLWDALLKRDANLMNFVNQEIGLVLASTFTRNAMLEGIHYTGIYQVVYPKDPELSLDLELQDGLNIKTTDSSLAINPVGPRPGINLDLSVYTSDPNLPYVGAPLINDVLADDFYIFTQAFYTQAQTGQSKLELTVNDYLNRRAIDNRLLVALSSTYQGWGRLEMFYYTPILLFLIQAAVRSL